MNPDTRYSEGTSRITIDKISINNGVNKSFLSRDENSFDSIRRSKTNNKV